jgi:hypothetical protein
MRLGWAGTGHLNWLCEEHAAELTAKSQATSPGRFLESIFNLEDEAGNLLPRLRSEMRLDSRLPWQIESLRASLSEKPKPPLKPSIFFAAEHLDWRLALLDYTLDESPEPSLPVELCKTGYIATHGYLGARLGDKLEREADREITSTRDIIREVFMQDHIRRNRSTVKAGRTARTAAKKLEVELADGRPLTVCRRKLCVFEDNPNDSGGGQYWRKHCDLHPTNKTTEQAR